MRGSEAPWAKGLCLCVFAFNNTSQQVSLPYAWLYSCVLPSTSNDLFWFQPRHHRPSALHWSLVKKHLSLAWLSITPTWSMGWCTNMSAAQESNPLSWRKSWNQKVVSISLQRYWKTYMASFIPKPNRETNNTGISLVAWRGSSDKVACGLLNPAWSFLH